MGCVCKDDVSTTVSKCGKLDETEEDAHTDEYETQSAFQEHVHVPQTLTWPSLRRRARVRPRRLAPTIDKTTGRSCAGACDSMITKNFHEWTRREVTDPMLCARCSVAEHTCSLVCLEILTPTGICTTWECANVRRSLSGLRTRQRLRVKCKRSATLSLSSNTPSTWARNLDTAEARDGD